MPLLTINADDVINPNAYGPLIAAQKRAQDAAARRRGELPADRKSRQQLLHEHAMRMINAQITDTTLGRTAATAVRATMAAAPYPPCVLPSAALRPISIRELRLETHHRGRYLLLRALRLPWKAAGLGTVVEDEEGEALQVQLYHQLRPHAPEDTGEKLFPIFSVFMVKEPYFKVTSDGGYGVQVDHVSDVVRLAADDERIPDAWRASADVQDNGAENWMEEGKKAVAANNDRVAVVKYTMALKRSTDIALARTILLHRAIAYLNLERFDAALEDALQACDDAKPSEEALSRAALALYHLGRYDDCSARREQLLREHPGTEADRGRIRSVQQRLHEQATGEYDFGHMYDVVRAGGRHLDIATFSGPVAVKPSPGRGLGLFTTRPVEAGELLLCEKAFAYCGVDEPHSTAGTTSEKAPSSTSPRRPPTDVDVFISLHYNIISTGKQPDLITTIIQKLYRNPSLARALTSVYRGAYKLVDEPRLVDEHPVVDSFLAERIVTLNAVGSWSTSFDFTFKQHAVNQATRDSSSDQDAKEEMTDLHESMGLWPLASHVNHNCCSTAERSIIGDALILRATRDLAADEEVTTAYRLADIDDVKRDVFGEHLRTQWGFECRCPLCVEARATPVSVCKKRYALKTELQATIGAVLVSMERTGADLRRGIRLEEGSIAPRMRVWSDLLTNAERQVDEMAKTYLDPPPKAAAAAASTSPGGSPADTTRPAGSSASGGRGGGAKAPAVELPAPRPHLSVTLAQLSMAWCRFGALMPRGLGGPVHAAHAANLALRALRVLGFVIRGGDLTPGAGRNCGLLASWASDEPAPGLSDIGHRAAATAETLPAAAATAAPMTTATAVTADLAGRTPTPAAADSPSPISEPVALRVERWGLLHEEAFRLWEYLARAYEVSGAPAAFATAAVRYLRTAYRMAIGEDEATFATIYPNWAHIV